MYLRHLTAKLALYRCDQCGIEFKRYVKDALEVHLCSRACVSEATKRGGAIWRKTSQTCMQRLGVETPFASSEVMTKQRQTCIERYGVENVNQIPEVQKRTKQTCIERYGVENVLSSPQFRERVKATLIERYGTNHPQRIPEVQERTQRTNVERYGVKNTLLLEHARERCNSPASHEKRYETMKRNGTYGHSKPEDHLYTLLINHFGADDVERQVVPPECTKQWMIDFHVKSLDLYIQLDGVYWHGLDRPIDVIAEGLTKRDVQIYHKYLTDRAQDEWFRTRGLKLLRLTDVQLRSMTVFGGTDG